MTRLETLLPFTRLLRRIPFDRDQWMLLMAVNLLFLGYFKYCNFFIESLNTLLSSLGATPTTFHLSVVLPVGISFYTFQSMSYIVDVYRGHVEPARDPIDFGLFVSFFPHMVAGPIMPSNQLLHQMQNPRRVAWERVMSGFHVAMLGLLKKVVVVPGRLVNVVV